MDGRFAESLPKSASERSEDCNRRIGEVYKKVVDLEAKITPELTEEGLNEMRSEVGTIKTEMGELTAQYKSDFGGQLKAASLQGSANGLQEIFDRGYDFSIAKAMVPALLAVLRENLEKIQAE